MKRAAVALCLLAAGCFGHAGAAQQPLPLCTLAPDAPARLAVEPCRPAPPKQGRARRAVPQVVERVPARPAPPPAVFPSVFPSAAPAPAAPVAPLPIIACDSGGCRDAAGVRHNGGVGNATLDPGGRPCVRNGAWLQCY